MSEADQIAEVQAIIDGIVAAERRMPVNWIVQAVMLQLIPPDVAAAHELITLACRTQVRNWVLQRLGLPDDTIEDEPFYSADELREQAAAHERHAETLLRQSELRKNRSEGADEQ